MTIIEIAKAQFPEWKESVDKINARARRLRFDGGITYTILGEKQRHGDFGGIEAQYKAYRVDVEIGVLHYQGWDVIAVINTDPQTGVTTVDSMPGYEGQFSRESVRKRMCDECQVIRKRNRVLVVREAATGKIKQVGGSCVRNYVGWSPTMPRLDLLLGLNEFLNYSVGRPEANDTLTVLAVAHDIVAQHGYLPVSSAEYYEIPTSERVKDALASSGYRCAMDPEEAIRLARGTVEWVMASDNDSDYMANLRAVAASDEVSDRHVGILASAVYAQEREARREAERAAENEAKQVSEWVGEVKERRDFDLTIDSIRTVSGQYGDTTIYSLSDADGSRFKWFASRAALGDYEGVNVTVKATVKKHAEWDGVKETHLTRAKLVRGTVVGFDADPHWCGGREREYSVGV